MKRIRSTIRFAVHAVALAFVLFLVPWTAGIASAASDPALAITTAGASLSVPELIGIGLAALAGLKALVDAALAFFRYLAPKTQTTVDDTIRDDLQLAHDKLDALSELVQSISKPVVVQNITAAAPAAVASPGPAPAKTSQGGFARLGLLLALAIGGGLLLAASGCTKVELGAAAASAEKALINCTGQAIGTTPALDIATLVAIANTVAAERAKCTLPGGSLSWSCVETDAIAAGKVLGGCTLVALVTGAVGAAPAAALRLASSTPAPPGRAELEDFRARVAGGATYHTASGDV